MYDDDSDGEGNSKFLNKNMKKIASGTAGGVKRVARGTRRMSLMAADNVKNVAANTAGNVKKVAAGTVDGAKSVMKKKKKKKKKKDKKSSKKQRGRSESPKRSNNSKPPVTKPGGIRSFFSPKRWRSASPAMGRGKKKSKVEEEEVPEPIAPLPSFTQPPVIVAPPDPAFHHEMNGGGGNAYANHKATSDAIGMSIRSLSSAQRYQRNQEQERIERDSQVPVFSVLLQSEHFLKYCDIAFDLVDSNSDDVVDETELYAGLLLIHLKLGSFLGPAACKPLSRDRCNAMFQRFDSTSTGGLDRNEFRRVMMVLFGNVFARVLVQYTLTIIIVPLVAKSVLEFLTWDSQGFWDYWTKPKQLRRMGEEFTLDYFVDWNVTSYPSSRRTFFSSLYRFVRIGSDAFWETFPLTFLTVILGLVIAPFVLYYFDDFFQYAVDWKENRSKQPAKRR